MNDQKLEKSGTGCGEWTFADCVGMKIVIPVLLSMGSYTSDDTRSCVNDDCFDLPAFANRKFQSEKSLILAISNFLMLKRLHFIKDL